MCDTTSGLALGTAGVGSALQIAGQNQAAKAQTNAAAAQAAVKRDALAKQGAYRDQNMASVQQTTQQASPDALAASTAGSAAKRSADYTAATASPTDAALSGSAGGNQFVSDALSKSRAANDQYFAGQSGALANMGGWSDALQGLNFSLGRNAQGINTTNSFARGDASLLPGQLRAIQPKAGAGRTLSGLGDLVVGGGQLATLGSTTGAWKNAFAATPSTTVANQAPAVFSGGVTPGLY